MIWCFWFLVWDGGEIGPRLVGNPQGSIRHFLQNRNSQKVGSGITWLMQLSTFYTRLKEEMDYFSIKHFLGKNSLKVCHFASWCLNILNHDLRCKFRAQTHIDAVQLPIRNHLYFYKKKLTNIQKILNSTSTTSMNSIEFQIRFWS